MALATSSAKAVETSVNTRSAFAIGFVCDYASVFLEIFSPFLCSPPRKLQPNRAVAAGTMSVTNTKVLLHEMQRERR
jgi:hypothetical protein